MCKTTFTLFKTNGHLVRRVVRGYGVKVYFKPIKKLRQLLMWPKDEVINERVVCPVYHINCDNCDESYIGETGRSLKSTFLEHKRPSSLNSKISRHLNHDQSDHSITLDNVRILEVVQARSEGNHPDKDQQPNTQQRCWQV